MPPPFTPPSSSGNTEQPPPNNNSGSKSNTKNQTETDSANGQTAAKSTDSPNHSRAGGGGPSGQKVSLPINVPEEELLKLHRFWDSQPVPRVSDDVTAENGPIDNVKSIGEVRQEPYNLPAPYEWQVLDVDNEEHMGQLFKLLEDHYVEDDDACFRFSYSRECLKWALTPPGYDRDWHIGVSANGRLYAFISGIPSLMSVHGTEVQMVIVNFLCVHQQLRAKRLAPVLIKEVTRRVNLKGIWQAVYTAGSFLPRPVGECQYFHRPLDIRKLVDVGFSRLQGRQTMHIAERLYALPTEQTLKGLRPMEERDVPIATKLLNEDFKKRGVKLHPVMSEADARHWLLPRDEVVYTYVLDNGSDEFKDFFSFYYLPSNVIRYNSRHKLLKAAYNFYSVATTVESKDLMHEALLKAKELKFDVYNALDLGDNKSCFKDPKFGPGDATLRYYLYNWNCPPVHSSQIGLILL